MCVCVCLYVYSGTDMCIVSFRKAKSSDGKPRDCTSA